MMTAIACHAWDADQMNILSLNCCFSIRDETHGSLKCPFNCNMLQRFTGVHVTQCNQKWHSQVNEAITQLT